jgi:hypothetical protein
MMIDREAGMGAPIVFVSRFRIAEGRRTSFADTFSSTVGSIDQEKPRTALYAAYLEASGSMVQIVHAFPDCEAMTAHFEGSTERTETVAELISLAGFTVYGAAPAAAVDQLRREADRTGGRLDLLIEPLGGFLRSVGG